MIKPGDIGFGGKRKGWYPSVVRWFTKSRWSHCFVVMPPYLGELSVLEADLKVQLVTFHKEYVIKNNDYYEIWRPTKANELDVYQACTKLYLNDAGEIYGFLQIPWFALRSICGWFGYRLTSNPFRSGEICSETQWQYLVNLGGEYEKAFRLYAEDENSPEDLYAIVKNRTDLFEFITVRE